jgi:hypothetical protein
MIPVMTRPIASRSTPARRFALAAVLLAAVAALGAPLAAIASPGVRPVIHYAAWEVTLDDIAGLGTPRPSVLVKAFSPTMDPVKYLNEAAKYHQVVLLYFTNTVDMNHGTINTAAIPGWVAKVKNHPALYGYLSVKEPSWSGISLAEMRSLYKAYKAADPNHPVVALLGDVPHFGTSQNPWSTGVANVLWVDWYPVTYSRGYIGTAPTHFPKVKSFVAKATPGTPIWLMVQGHGYRKGDRRTPTSAELTRQVNDGFRYLDAAGIAFYTWHNALYDRDLERNPTLWATARSLMQDGIGAATTR